MALTIATPARSAQAVALRDLIDAAVGDGYLELLTSANVLLATLTFDAASFTESAGVLTMAGAPKSTAAAVATGTATKFRIYDADAVQLIEGTVGTSGSDLNITDTSIVTSEVISVTSFTITDPAS